MMMKTSNNNSSNHLRRRERPDLRAVVGASLSLSSSATGTWLGCVAHAHQRPGTAAHVSVAWAGIARPGETGDCCRGVTARKQDGGRCWVRTSDPCRVKTVLYR